MNGYWHIQNITQFLKPPLIILHYYISRLISLLILTARMTFLKYGCEKFNNILIHSYKKLIIINPFFIIKILAHTMSRNDKFKHSFKHFLNHHFGLYSKTIYDTCQKLDYQDNRGSFHKYGFHIPSKYFHILDPCYS